MVTRRKTDTKSTVLCFLSSLLMKNFVHLRKTWKQIQKILSEWNVPFVSICMWPHSKPSTAEPSEPVGICRDLRRVLPLLFVTFPVGYDRFRHSWSEEWNPKFSRFWKRDLILPYIKSGWYIHIVSASKVCTSTMLLSLTLRKLGFLKCEWCSVE
jgi:hypothetical protein